MAALLIYRFPAVLLLEVAGDARGSPVLLVLLLCTLCRAFELDSGGGSGCLVAKVAFFEKSAVVGSGGTAVVAGFRLFRGNGMGNGGRHSACET